MKLLFACGGTAGHINPALAVAAYVRGRNKDAQILFAGNPNGMEARLVPKAGFAFIPIVVEGFQRKISLENVGRNFSAVLRLLQSGPKARTILKEFEPDIVIGTGGYVSGPILYQAAKMGYKTMTHEQNAFPGVTTKALVPKMDKVLLAVEKARDYLPGGREYVVTGNPIREDILFADRQEARKRLGAGDKFCLLSFGGSLGAARINQSVASVVAWHLPKGKIHHIHATGRYGVEMFPSLLKELGVRFKDNPDLDIREYIDNMPECLAAADLVICRAGALSLSELQAAGKASILIPSPNVAENHQYHNAMVLANAGAAVVIEEKDLTGEVLTDSVQKLLNDGGRLRELSENARSMAIIDANRRIYQEISKLLEN